MKTENLTLNINEIKPNSDNPRVITSVQLNKLKKSLTDFPEMISIRPLVINQDNVVLGGNMRLKALSELGYSNIPVLKVYGLTPEQEKEFVIKNNLSYGEWNWETIPAQYDLDLVNDWGLDLPSTLFDDDEEPQDIILVDMGGLVKQITFNYDQQQYKIVLDKLMAVQRREDLLNFTEAVILLVNEYYDETD